MNHHQKTEPGRPARLYTVGCSEWFDESEPADIHQGTMEAGNDIGERAKQ
jgi:hypothetical protein